MGLPDARFYVVNKDGLIRRLGPCRGFALLPGKAADAKRTTQLGSYPVTARIFGQKDYAVSNDAVNYFDEEISFDVVGNPGESWLVVLFDKETQGIRLSGGKTRSPCELVAAGTDVPQVDPANDDDGYALHPADRSLKFYFDDTATNVQLWEMALDGTWRMAEQFLITDGDARPAIRRRDVDQAIGRFALVSDAAGATFGIDKEQEAG